MALDLLRWTSQTVAEVERLTGIPSAATGRSLRVIVRENLEPQVRSNGTATVAQHVEDGVLVQTLLITGYAQLDRGTADDALCQLLVYRYVADHGDVARLGRAYAQWVSHDLPAAVPVWLWRGLSGCLANTVQDAASRDVSEAWHQGTLRPLTSFLSAGGRVSDEPESVNGRLQRSFETVLVGWLVGLPESGLPLGQLFARLGRGEALTPEALAALMPDCQNLVDLEERWDAWVLAQNRKIFLPGVTRSIDVQRLREELSLRPGLFGIPAESPFPPGAGFRDLLGFRRERWLPALAELKRIRLCTLALGRGQPFRDTVDQYCLFLAALAGHAPEHRLVQLLDQAEVSLRALGTAPAPGN